MASVRRGQALPHARPTTEHSPSATGGHLGESAAKKGQNTARWQRAWEGAWETALQAPRRGRKGSGHPCRDSLAAPEEDHSREGISLSPVERAMVEQVSILQPLENARWSRFSPEGLQPAERTHAGAGEECEESLTI